MKKRLLFALVTLAISYGGPVTAGEYPAKPISIIVGFPAGTTGDLLARTVAPRLADQLGQSVVIENRPGAGSNIAAEAVARSAADGYTLLLSTTANVINPHLFPNLGYDFTRDLTPVALVAEAPAVLVAPASLAANSISELISAAKSKPGAMTFGSSGNGTFTHLYGELFNQSAGVQLTHVPYKGSSQALTDALAGRIDLLFTPASTVLPHIKDGKLKALGTIGQQRMPELPDVPLFAEAGISGFDSALWFGLNAPAGTPSAIVDKLSEHVLRVLATPDIKTQLAARSVDTGVAAGPKAFSKLIAQENDKWGKVVKAANIKRD